MFHKSYKRGSMLVPVLGISALVLTYSSLASAQAPALITQPVNENNLVTLTGNTRPEATASNDLGRVDDNLPLQHMLLQLKRSSQQEAALETLISQLHDSTSPNFHQWLNADQFGQQFGLASQDIGAISSWLTNHGFTVNTVYPSGVLLDFSGTAGQVRTAFHTEIHNLNVGGVAHIANMTDPKIPAALAPAVEGVVSLHNFMPHPAVTPRPSYTFPSSGFTEYAIVPADLATIYNLNPVFTSKVVGTGQTIAVLEDSDVYSTADFTTFRTTFGLTRFGNGTLTQVHPPSSGTNNCTDPGVNSNDFEAILDAEYASAAAPAAAIELASCTDTTTTFGGLIALNNLISAKKVPGSISISYGECEPYLGQAGNASFKTAYQQAVTLGVSVYVAAGDWGADVCDASFSNGVVATHGINVNGFASTPYNVAVGGTDFSDLYQNDSSTYFSSTNSKYYGSAKSYVPEVPWNNTCASTLLANYFGFSTTYGTTGLCNSSTGASFISIVAGSGGPSGCATGTASISGQVSGTCKGYPRPSWQTGVPGLPANSVRSLPDVSLFASNGFLGHYYVVCYSDTANGGTACTGAPSGWSGAGGTSFASPIMAGVQALINQSQGARQGNPNPVFYKLAAAQYGGTGLSTCNSSLGNGTATTCTFYDQTQGDMDVPCQGKVNCYDPSGTYGVLSKSSTAYSPAFPTTSGWDFATGLGSVNVSNLVTNWSSGK